MGVSNMIVNVLAVIRGLDGLYGLMDLVSDCVPMHDRFTATFSCRLSVIRFPDI
jgi:hypothetical protein